MSDDHILLHRVMEDHGITATQLSFGVGRAVSTVYCYISGSKGGAPVTIPSIVWRWLYGKTRDARIVKLVTGDVPVITVPLITKAAKVDKATLMGMLDAREKSLEFERRMIHVLKDGKIDQLDRSDIAALKKDFPAMITALAELYQAVTNEYDMSVCA